MTLIAGLLSEQPLGRWSRDLSLNLLPSPSNQMGKLVLLSKSVLGWGQVTVDGDAAPARLEPLAESSSRNPRNSGFGSGGEDEGRVARPGAGSIGGRIRSGNHDKTSTGETV